MKRNYDKHCFAIVVPRRTRRMIASIVNITIRIITKYHISPANPIYDSRVSIMVLIDPGKAGEPDFHCREGGLRRVYPISYIYLNGYYFGPEGPAIPYLLIFSCSLTRWIRTVSYTHLRAHETRHDLVCRLLL